jgi:hypothetical protein
MQQTTSLRAVLLGAAIISLAACGDTGRGATEPGARIASPAATPIRAEQKTLENKGRNDVQIVRATGDITAAVTQYRALLGEPNNLAAAAEFEKGRREINWDAAIVPTNTDAFPGNFFNVNSPRGAVFTTDGSGLRVSNNGYTDVNPNYVGEFNTFSPPKLFVAVGSTTIDIQFFVAGSNKPAVVTGFGSVFADVGRAHSTTIEYFDAAGNSLLKVAAPRRSDDKGLSFLGAKFASAIVARVRIVAGDTPIGADNNDNVKGPGQKHDIVATDDFFYGEPHEIK